MDDRHNEHTDHDFNEEIIQQLRESALRDEQAPSGERESWRPKELSLKFSAWVVRGFIVALVMIFIGEVYLLSQMQPEETQQVAEFQGGPERKIIPAPVVKAPQEAPPIASPDNLVEGADPENEYPVPPTPTPPPLPVELQDLEIPPPGV